MIIKKKYCLFLTLKTNKQKPNSSQMVKLFDTVSSIKWIYVNLGHYAVCGTDWKGRKGGVNVGGNDGMFTQSFFLVLMTAK